MSVKPHALHHFSEDPSIERFLPHVPRTNPTHPPKVWAIDHEHSPLYWFPRDCPRVAIWAHDPSETATFNTRFATTASRIHAIETSWVERMRNAVVYRYELDPGGFVPWPESDGQWICDRDVVPVSVSPVGDLLAAHADAQIELRIVPSLWPLHDVARHMEFDFSIVRMHNAQPRTAP